MRCRILFASTLALALGTTGCATTMFVVQRDVPQAPTSVVFPASISKEDQVFADEITGYLIANRVRVVERPPMISGELRTSASGRGAAVGFTPGVGPTVAGGRGTSESDQVGQVGDVVSLYSQTDADLVFVARSKDRWVKVVLRKNNEIIFSACQGTQQNSETEGRAFERKLIDAIQGKTPN